MGSKKRNTESGLSRIFEKGVWMLRIFFLVCLLFIYPLHALERASLPYAYPNPFHTTEAKLVRIVIPICSLMAIGYRDIDIYSRHGVFVRRMKAVQSNRSYTAVWDGLDKEQKPVPPGVYFVQVRRGNNNPYVFSLMLFR